MAAKKIKCCVPECSGDRIAGRGLCAGCYTTARYLIRSGRTSWEQLEALGLATPKRAINTSPLLKAFERATIHKTRTRRI